MALEKTLESEESSVYMEQLAFETYRDCFVMLSH